MLDLYQFFGHVNPSGLIWDLMVKCIVLFGLELGIDGLEGGVDFHKRLIKRSRNNGRRTGATRDLTLSRRHDLFPNSLHFFIF